MAVLAEPAQVARQQERLPFIIGQRTKDIGGFDKRLQFEFRDRLEHQLGAGLTPDAPAGSVDSTAHMPVERHYFAPGRRLDHGGARHLAPIHSLRREDVSFLEDERLQADYVVLTDHPPSSSKSL